MEIKDGGSLPPWYYGRAYHNYVNMSVIYYPIPFNLVMYLGMRIWNVLKYGARDEQLNDAYHAGRKQMHEHLRGRQR